MRRRTSMMLAVLLLFLLPAAIAKGQTGIVKRGGIVMVWTGTYTQDDPAKNLTGKCSATGCAGDMVSCAPADGIIVTKLIFSFIARICDDKTDQLPACAGRFTALVEECSGPGDIVNVGALTALSSSGEIRVCLDGGDCSGSAPGTVIATGTMRTQRRYGPGLSSVFGNSSMARLAKSRFRFDGRRTKLRLWRTHFEDFWAAPNDGVNCGAGCAVAGVTVKDQKQ